MDHTMSDIEKVIYTAKTPTVGGRDGSGKSSDGQLDVKLSSAGTKRPGTNPEQLFAVGWSACFMGAMGLAAGKKKIALPPDTSIDAEVDLCMAGEDFRLQARLNVHAPGLAREVVETLAHEAHRICPYSKATRGNFDVTIHVI
jgi:osmotically inducible protein OsmC